MQIEFLKNLADRILKKPQKPQIPANGQLDLFAEFPVSEVDTAKNSSFESLKTTPHNYKLVDNEEDLKKLCDYFLTNEILSLDTETTSTSAIDAELVGLSFAVKEFEAFYIPIPANREEALRIVNIFKEVYENDKILKVGQNLKYDLEVLRNYDIHLAGPMWDTMIAHYLIQPELKHGIDYIAETMLNYQKIHTEELIGKKGKNQLSFRDLAPQKVYEYACEDADIALQLKNRLESELKNKKCEYLFYNIEMPLMQVLAEMEINGVCIDANSLKEISSIFSNRLKEAEKEIYEIAGEEFNISSPKQVGDILFGKLKIIDNPKKSKSWQYVTNEKELEEIKESHVIVGKILEYRKLNSILTERTKKKPAIQQTPDLFGFESNEDIQADMPRFVNTVASIMNWRMGWAFERF